MVEWAEQMCWRDAEVSAYPTQAEAAAVGTYLADPSRAVAVPYYRVRRRLAPGPEHRRGLLLVGGSAPSPTGTPFATSSARCSPRFVPWGSTSR